MTAEMASEADRVYDISDFDDDSDVDDDRVMEWIATGNLPASTETSLALNQAYQELLQMMMRRIEGVLAENREKQRNVEQQFEKLTNTQTKQQLKVPVMQYLPPYFRDTSGTAPPNNLDTLRKRKRGEIELLVEQPRKWSKIEQEKLVKAVESSMVDCALLPLQNKRDCLAETLRETSLPEEMNSLVNQIKECDRKIEVSRNKFSLASMSPKAFEDIEWTKISVVNFEGTRTPVECRLAWTNQFDPRINQSATWTREEVTKLAEIAKANEYKNWNGIAQQLGTGRTGFQCFEKFQSDVNDHKKRPWTTEEDERLREVVEACRYGHTVPWEQVAHLVEGRTRQQVQTRWMRTVSPAIKRGFWSEDEDLLLIYAVEKYGAKSWVKLCHLVPGRTDSQCRERWITLSPNIKYGPWSAEEDQLLANGIKEFGKGEWTKISRLIPGRTPTACKGRFRLQQRKGGSEQFQADSNPAETSKTNGERCCKFKERKDRVFERYANVRGTVPRFDDLDTLLSALPEDIRRIFGEKLKAIQAASEAAAQRIIENHIADSNKSPEQNRKRKRKDTKRKPDAKKPRRTEEITPVDLAIYSEIRAFESQMSTKESKPTDAEICFLENELKNTKTLFPPNTATLKAYRNLLLERQKLEATAEPVRVAGLDVATFESAGPNESLTMDRGNPVPLQSYLDEQITDAPGTSSTSNAAQFSDTVPFDLLSKQKPSVVNSFIELRDTFRQIFAWPSLLATLPMSQE